MLRLKKHLAYLPMIIAGMMLVFGCRQEAPMSGKKEPGSQQEIAKGPDENGIYTVVKDQPEPVGGISPFYERLSKRLQYTEEAKKAGLEGKVFVQFVVTESGELTELQVLKGFEENDHGLHEVAKKALEKSEKWQPGKTEDGKPVKVRMVLPITFKL